MKNQISESAKEKVMNFFSSLADDTRLNILLSLANGKKNVNEIHKFVGKEKMSLPAISHQLKLLYNQRVVKKNKRGKEIYYELSDEFCWCILGDAFKQFNNRIEIKCEKCGKECR